MNHRSLGRRLRLFALLLVAALVLPPQAEAQTARDAFRFSERLPATGARMIGLGGASIGGIADPSALFTNPAGLGYATSSMVSGALNTFGVSDEAFYDVPGFSSSFDSDVTATTLGNLGYVYKAPTRRGSLVIGAAYNQTNTFERDLRFQGNNGQSTITTSFLPFDNEFSIDADGGVTISSDLAFAGFVAGAVEYFPEFLDDDPNAYPFLEAVEPGTTIEQRGTVIEEGRMNEFNVGGAWEASPGVMLGLSANLAFGSYDLLNVFEEADVFGENGPAQYSVLLDDGSLLEGFDFFEYRQTLETDLVGINLRAGLAGQVTPNVRVGASVETPTYYAVDEVFSTRLETFFDRGGSLSYGDDPSDSFGNGEFEYEIRSPWRLGAGATFTAANLTFLADAEFVDWGQLELDADDPFVFADVNEQIQEDYEAVINARVGAEYRIEGVALRAGFAYRPDPLAEAARPVMNDGTELDRTKTFFSAGIGYRFNQQFQVDVGWMQSRFDDVYEAYPDISIPGFVSQESLLVDEEIVRNQFVLGVRYFF
ncbi:MAG: hypothetical protein GVY18_11630 [Bacteroidetes bacterium]|jgi:long-subunit fatty acid transport protein|nr:hypothetical protein [Bacteroidota bacterium]